MTVKFPQKPSHVKVFAGTLLLLFVFVSCSTPQNSSTPLEKTKDGIQSVTQPESLFAPEPLPDLGELPEDFASIKIEKEGWQKTWLAEKGLFSNAQEHPGTIEDWNLLLNRGEQYVARIHNKIAEDRIFLTGSGNPKPMDLYAAVRQFAQDCMSFSEWFLQRQDARNVRFEAWSLECGLRPSPQQALEGIAIILRTEEYIAGFDPDAYYYKGCDILSARYNPYQLGKPLDELDIVFDYDYERVKKTEKMLWGVDRRRTLLSIFNRVTKDAKTDTERHIAVSAWLSGVQFHSPFYQAAYNNETLVHDPLMVLELAEMRCGIVARAGGELFAAAGYPFRLLTGNAHAFAEIYYEDTWHLLDVDLLPYGRTVLVDGRIPSIAELSKTPELVDSLGGKGWKNYIYSFWLANDTVSIDKNSPMKLGAFYPSPAYFGRPNPEIKPVFSYKAATPFQSLDYLYGWDYYEQVEDTERIMQKNLSFEDRRAPYIPYFTGIEQLDNATYLISWESYADDRDILAGYRVYLSRTTRNWDWALFTGTSDVELYRSGSGYTPEMYALMENPLPQDIAVIEKEPEETSITVSVEPGETVYISLIAYDVYGEKVGNTIYPPTSELKLAG